MKTSVWAMALSLLVWYTGQAAYAAGAFEQGVSFYNARKYKHAVVYLSQAASLDPTNSLCHYYLANTLTHLNQLQEALLEYQICKRLDPEGPVASYCRQALDALSSSGQAHAHLAREASVSYADTAGGASGDRHYIYSRHPAVNRAMFVIKREAEYEKGRHKFQAEVKSKATLAMAEQDAKQIQAQAAEDMQRVYSDSWVTIPTAYGYTTVNPYLFNPDLARIRTDEIKRSADDAEKRVRRLAEVRANEYKNWSEERQKSLDEVVSNLKSQMEQPAGPSGVKLQPVGTDLYVRYYGNYGNSGQKSNINAQNTRSEAALAAKRTQGHFIGDDSGDSSTSKIIKMVRGKVLH